MPSGCQAPYYLVWISHVPSDFVNVPAVPNEAAATNHTPRALAGVAWHAAPAHGLIPASNTAHNIDNRAPYYQLDI
eukprot:scaffold70562_cov19-Prasinocladus_malaysianus.AAC.1